MTQAEFVKGWKLLILQTWGWRYRTLTDGKPSEESMAQLNFYFDKLKWAQPGAWLKVAELYAQESEWPSVKMLNTALQHDNKRHVRGIEDQREQDGVPIPPEVQAIFASLMSGKGMPR